MRKNLLFLSALFCFVSFASIAQLTTLYHFPDGSVGNGNYGNPQGRLSFSGNKFFSAQPYGQMGSGYGSIYEFDVTTNTYGTEHEFVCATESCQPMNGVVLHGSKLYGVLAQGGPYNTGSVYSYDTLTQVFTTLYNFTGGNDGGQTVGQVLIHNNKIYSSCQTGGVNGAGTIWSMNLDGSGFEVLHSFSVVNNSYVYPQGYLIVDGNFIYGTTHRGGVNGKGSIFKIDLLTNTYTELFSHSGTDGAQPQGLLKVGNMLYGVSSFEAANELGNIFSYNLSNNTYNVLYSFGQIYNAGDGSSPRGLTLSGSLLYGVTYYGGSVGAGVLFSYDISTNTFNLLESFGGQTTGTWPWEAPVVVGDVLYGTTTRGGTNNVGVIYKYQVPIPGASLDFDGENDYISVNVLPHNSYTKQAWIKPSSTTGNKSIISTSNAIFGLNNGQLMATNAFAPAGVILMDASPIALNTWTHVAVTYDATTTTMKLYKNGVQVDQTTNADLYQADYCTIGSRITTDLFDGAIDEVKVYDYALTQCELQESMTCELAGAQTGLKLYYKFNQGAADGNNPTVNTVVDFSGNSFTGSMNNFALSGVNGSNWTLDGAVESGVSCTPYTLSNVEICAGESYFAGGALQTVAGTYIDQTTNSSGCDITVQTVLTIKPVSTGSLTVTQCGSYTWNGTTYTSTPTTAPTHVYTSANGCDSTVTLNLTILNPSNATDMVDACEPIVWIDGNTYSANNNTATFLVPGGNAAGCDSTVTLNLTITTVNSGATLNGNTLTATQANADSYQWFDCETNAEIVGAASQTFTATENGSYYAEVTLNECLIETECLDVTTIGLSENKENLFSIYPNPANEYFILTSTIANGKISISDMNGRVVLDQVTVGTSIKINTSTFTNGVYFVEFSDLNAATIQRIKLVINK